MVCRVYAKYLQNPDDSAIENMIRVVGFETFSQAAKSAMEAAKLAMN